MGLLVRITWCLLPVCLAAADPRLEADWLAQVAVRGLPSGPVTTAEDAAGAVDGVKDGSWAFHTDLQDQPWWQVDLGLVQPIARVVVYNRCDIPSRTNGFRLLVSDDGQTWREAYRHGNDAFCGATDGKALALPLADVRARFVRIQLPGQQFLHLDEVEVYGPADPEVNLALYQPADQSSVSRWSKRPAPRQTVPVDVIEEAIRRGRALVDDLGGRGVDTSACRTVLDRVASRLPELAENSEEDRRQAYFEVRRAVRALALSNPLLDFDALVYVERAPGQYSHMSDQNYGWWSRPGGGIYVLEQPFGDQPRRRCLTPELPTGSFLSPDLSYDGRKILFAYCRWYPETAGNRNKVDKESIPEDAFYHLYEVSIDGSGLRQLTSGHYDDFDGRWLPGGDIAFLSTRRGQTVQCTPATAQATLTATLPDSYVRCGGGAYRPVAVYTLHRLSADGGLRALSPFENFEWTPSVAPDGRLLYARWDYVDRDNMPYMSLWSTNPDGTQPRIVYGNHTPAPHCIFEARAIPHSRKLIFTASAHHSISGGSLVLLDPDAGVDGPAPLTRLTPEVCFPEIEGWPQSYYASPWPLSERYYLCAWSPVPLGREGAVNPVNALGLYLFDTAGNLELLWRDPELSSLCPLPLRTRTEPPRLASEVDWSASDEGRFLITDIYQGLPGIARGSVQRLRVVAMPPKTQPTMNSPVLGVTRDDPGKCVLGTVPVSPDGSAWFRVPAGVAVFFQALDADGRAVRSMRSLTYVQAGQTASCIGCHESRSAAPSSGKLQAMTHPPSRLKTGPDGSWPLRYDRLIQPLLDQRCVTCHQPGKPGEKVELTADKSYDTLLGYGSPSLREYVLRCYREGRSLVGDGGALSSPLLALLTQPKGHQGVTLTADERERLITWLDTYGQRQGAFSAEQEAELVRLRGAWAGLVE